MSRQEINAPPGLPDRLRDEHEDDGPQSTWDVLARAIVKDSVFSLSHRCRVRWLRWCLFRWCCRHPMRLGRIEYQDRSVTFGWQRANTKVVACNRCGRFADSF